MKKNVIMIAAVAVLTAASAAKAGIGFDGKTRGAISFMEAVKAVEVSQDTKPAPEKYPREQLLAANCIAATMCGGMQYLAEDCRCKPLPGYEIFFNERSYEFASSSDSWSYKINNGSRFDAAAQGAAAQRPLQPAKTRDRAAKRGLARYYLEQKDLRNIILAHFNPHNSFSSGIFQALQDEKTIILYDNKGVYFANGKTIYGTNNKELAKEVAGSMGRQNKAMGREDIGVAVVLGCVFSDDCRKDAADYVNNLHDDEHDTCHNNSGGSNPNYEVNKRVK